MQTYVRVVIEKSTHTVGCINTKYVYTLHCHSCHFRRMIQRKILWHYTISDSEQVLTQTLKNLAGPLGNTLIICYWLSSQVFLSVKSGHINFIPQAIPLRARCRFQYIFVIFFIDVGSENETHFQIDFRGQQFKRPIPSHGIPNFINNTCYRGFCVYTFLLQ